MSDIVLASDGSEHSLAAAKYVVSANLAPAGSRVHVLHVSAPLTGRAASLVGTQAVTEWYRDEAAEATGPLLEVLHQGGVEAEAQGLIGHAPREIVRYAEQVGASMIVLGAHGRGVFLDAIVGSVAGRVLALAKCPVLLVK